MADDVHRLDGGDDGEEEEVVHDQLPSVQEIHKKSKKEVDRMTSYDERTRRRRQRRKMMVLSFLAVLMTASAIASVVIIFTHHRRDDNDDDESSFGGSPVSWYAPPPSPSPTTSSTPAPTTVPPTRVASSSPSKSSSPSAAPSAFGRRQEIAGAVRRSIARLGGNVDVVAFPSSATQEAALDWMTNEDVWDPVLDDSALFAVDADAAWTERYVVALLHFGTNGTGWNVEHQALWLSEYDVCHWDYGVRCNDDYDDGRVTTLELYDGGLYGQIPTELALLTSLVSVDLSSNDLEGPVPTEVGSLTSLRYLNLGHNELTGTIPTELGRLENLNDLLLRYNDLSGDVPRELFEMGRSGTTVYLGHNDRLQGCDPDVFVCR